MRYAIKYIDTDEKTRSTVVNVVDEKFIAVAVKSQDRRLKEIVSISKDAQ